MNEWIVLSSLWYWLFLLSLPTPHISHFPPSLFKRKQSPLTVCWATKTPPVPCFRLKVQKKKKLISWSDPNGLSEAQHSLAALNIKVYQLWYNYLWWFFNFLPFFSLSRKESFHDNPTDLLPLKLKILTIEPYEIGVFAG